MKSKRSSRSWLPSPMVAVVVGVICIVYVQVTHSASITVSSGPRSSSSTNTSAPTNTTVSTTKSKVPSKITTLRSRMGTASNKKQQPRQDPPTSQPGRLKASDMKACISKAFCEVNSASKVPNYSVNKEFFDLMNKIHAKSEEEEADSGSMSLEDEDEDEEEEDDDVSSEESSSERIRGYPPPPPPPPGFRFGRDMKDNSTVEAEETKTINGTSIIVKARVTPSPVNVKSKDTKKKIVNVKKMVKKTKVSGKKTVKKSTKIVPKRRSRLEKTRERAQREAYLTRKQREMGQVNDLAALIRISADIGLTLRNPKKCKQIFNKCSMTHEQIVDLFNQTLMAVTTPASFNNVADNSVPTTKRTKVTTTLAALVSTKPTLASLHTSTAQMLHSEQPTVVTSVKTTVGSPPSTTTSTTTTTHAPTTTTDENRSSKSRHDFYDEDVEYMTETEIQPVQTYALFVNDVPEENVKTAEEVNIPETFKKYANAFPAEAPLPGDLPSLRDRNKEVKEKESSRSTKSKANKKKAKPSSEEDDDDDDDDEDDLGSVSLENRSGPSYHRHREPHHHHHHEHDEPDHDIGYRGVKGADAESGEPASFPKESTEALPPLVPKDKPKKRPVVDEDEEDEEESDESGEAEADEIVYIHKPSNDRIKSKTTLKGKKKGKSPVKKIVPIEDDESSEEDGVRPLNDDQQAPPPWGPTYQTYKGEKQKQGHKKKQKGPYKGGEGPYADSPMPIIPPTQSHNSGGGGMLSNALNSFKKPWGSSSSSNEMGQDQGPHHSNYHRPSSHEAAPYGGPGPYHHDGAPPPEASPYPGPPGSQEAASEQKPGFFQSIMSWFTGNKNNDQSNPSQPDPYGAPPYGNQPPYGGGSSEHMPHHHYHDDHPQDDYHHDDRHHESHKRKPNKRHQSHSDERHESATGAPWPSQPDPAGVGHFGQTYNNAYRYKQPDSMESEEDSNEEILLEEPIKPTQKKRRFRGRSDSIITAPPKKTSPKKGKTSGPPPPVVIVPKEKKSSPVGIYEPNLHYEKLIQADGLTSGSNLKKKSNNEYKRTKKAAIKPKNSKPSTKKNKLSKPARTSRESAEDDDEAYSSEEVYNQNIAKLKTVEPIKFDEDIAALGVSSSNSNSNGANTNGGSTKNYSKNKNKPMTKDPSYTQYFETMFGTEAKDKLDIKGKDDGSLLYGFEALSSQLNASPTDLPAVTTKTKKSSYKINKTKKKPSNSGTSSLALSPAPVKFNNKEKESSEEEDKKK